MMIENVSFLKLFAELPATRQLLPLSTERKVLNIAGFGANDTFR
jgi:hypothetical protein